MKILVLKRDKLGDLLLTTPMFARLRDSYPDARIELLASQYNAWVADGNPNLDQIHAYPRVRTGRKVDIGAALSQIKQFLQLRRSRYDWIIVAQGEESPRAIQRALFLKADRIVAYANSPMRSRRALTDALRPPSEGHEARRLMELLQPMHLPLDLPDRAPQFNLPETARARAQAWLDTQGLSAGTYLVLGLGARRARKQPDTAQILRWVDQIQLRFGLKTVFMWTPGASDNPLYPGDDEIAAPVLAAQLPSLLPFRGPLLPALGLIWSARTSIFPDSGLMHFASASPGGVLGLFGDTEAFAQKWAPLGPNSRHLVAERVSLLSDEQLFEALGPLVRGLA